MKKDDNALSCDYLAIHEDVVNSVRSIMPQEEAREEAAAFLKLLSDSTRIGILMALNESEMCGCDLCAILNMTQSAISHQLRILKQAGFVRSRREGKMIFFRLADTRAAEILTTQLAHVSESGVL